MREMCVELALKLVGDFYQLDHDDVLRAVVEPCCIDIDELSEDELDIVAAATKRSYALFCEKLEQDG